MKRICFLPYDEKRGTVFHLVELLEKLGKQNYFFEIFVVTLIKEQNSGLNEKLKKLANSYKNFNVFFINSSKDLENLVFLNEIDIVHCNAYRQTNVLLRTKKKKGYKFKIILTLHSFMNGTWLKTIFSNFVSFFILNKINCIHFLSTNARDEFLKHNIFISKKVLDITFPLGCNPNEFINISEPDTEFKEYFSNRYNKTNFNIIYLANFSRIKNHMYFIKIIMPLLFNNKIKVWFFGDGKLLKKIIRYVYRKKLDKYFEFPGRVNRMYIPYVLQFMDLAVSVSKSETFSHSILEPLFAGIPVISFNVGTAPNLIIDFLTGFNIKKNDAVNFRNKLGLLIQDKYFTKQLGENAKKLVFNYYTWNKIANFYLLIYSKLI